MSLLHGGDKEDASLNLRITLPDFTSNLAERTASQKTDESIARTESTFLWINQLLASGLNVMVAKTEITKRG